MYSRSILNSLHGVWNIGAVLGGLMGSAAAGLDIPLAVHLSIAAGTFSLVALVAYRFLLPGPEDAEREAEAQDLAAADGHPAAPPARHGGWRSYRGPAVRMLAALSVLAACGALVEDAGASWGAIYLNDYLHTSAATAGLAVVVFQAAMTIGRLAGDRIVDRFGQRTVARAGAALAALGMALALATVAPAGAIAGFAAVGLGLAALFPLALRAAAERGESPGPAVAAVSALGYCGFLAGPPAVGGLAEATELRVGLVVVALLCALAAALARAACVPVRSR
jgi:predicted MFS family arabinose efflux permease